MIKLLQFYNYKIEFITDVLPTLNNVEDYVLTCIKHKLKITNEHINVFGSIFELEEYKIRFLFGKMIEYDPSCINLKDNEGRNALHLISIKDKHNLIELLEKTNNIYLPGCINEYDNNDMRPIDYALKRESFNCIYALCMNGAYVSDRMVELDTTEEIKMMLEQFLTLSE